MKVAHWLGRLALVLAVAAPAWAGQDPFGKQRQGRLSDGLSRVADAAERGEGVSARRFTGVSKDGQRVRAVVELDDSGNGEALTARVEALGGRVTAASGRLLRVDLPVRALRGLASEAGVRRVREPFRPSQKEVVSEGSLVMHAPEFRARTGADGAGVAVAVMDQAFDRAEDLLGGELPEDTRGTDFVLDRIGQFGDVHGTACAEIVYDMAPGAQITLAGFEDEVQWAEEIDRLVGSGYRIISHSIGFDNLFPPDGRNYFGEKVDQAAAAGVLFVTAAGNEAGNYYQGGWRDSNANGFLDFGGVSELLPFYAEGYTRIVLRWDDSFGRSNHDYDLLVVTPEFLNNSTLSLDNPAIVAASADLQNGDDDPREIVNLEVEEGGVLYLVVVRDPSSPLQSSQRFYLWAQKGIDPAFANGSGTLSMPGDARGAFTVGAVGWDSGVVEGFSSRGPTSDGRVKPDVAGPDGVSTASYDGAPYYGTSAATPHVSGAAALLLSRNPSLSLSALRSALEQATASAGRTKNNDVGYGLVDLNLAR